MIFLLLIGLTILLLGGFFMLVEYETRHEMRFFAQERARLDRSVERTEFIFKHIDIGAFLRDELRNFVGRVSHDIAHLSLQAVRAVEHLLTRLVRHLRSRHAVDIPPRENAREFVRALSDFKDHLKETHPRVGDIQ